MKTQLNKFKLAALGVVTAGSMMAAQTALALPAITLPGGNTTVVGPADGFGPIDLGQLNAIANGGAAFGFNWPLFGTGVPGTVGSETMFWDIMSITDSASVNTTVGTATVFPATFNSNYYLEFGVSVLYLAPNLDFDTFRWRYTGGTIRLCQDLTGTGGAAGTHECDTVLATISVTGGNGGLNAGAGTQLNGSLDIRGDVTSQLASVFEPDAAFNFNASDIFTASGVTAFGGGFLPLQTFGGAAPPDIIGPNQIVSFTVVPEPSAVALLGIGLVGLGLAGRRRRK